MGARILFWSRGWLFVGLPYSPTLFSHLFMFGFFSWSQTSLQTALTWPSPVPTPVRVIIAKINSWRRVLTNQTGTHIWTSFRVLQTTQIPGPWNVNWEGSSRIYHWIGLCWDYCMLSKLRLFRYIIIENLAQKFQAPNVLDLKLGTRQYSDNASSSKKESQRLKCAKSTSKQLGLRMCGLQYFDENIDAFQCLDKYYGRNLNESGLYKLLARFFKSRTNDCLLLMEQIEKIKKVSILMVFFNELIF